MSERITEARLRDLERGVALSTADELEGVAGTIGDLVAEVWRLRKMIATLEDDGTERWCDEELLTEARAIREEQGNG
jgi:hypothetical protein